MKTDKYGPREVKFRSSRKARTQQNCEAWFYEFRSRIEIYIHTKETGPTVVASISRKQVESWLRRIKESKP